MKTYLVLVLLITRFNTTPVLDPVNPEQIAFDYFISDILKDDFKKLTAIEFAGTTEENYSALGDYEFCLTPERLGPIVKSAAQGQRQPKEIRVSNFSNIAIASGTQNKNAAKLYVYPSVMVADSHYVLISIKVPNEAQSTYLFEVTQEGSILRSCKSS